MHVLNNWTECLATSHDLAKWGGKKSRTGLFIRCLLFYIHGKYVFSHTPTSFKDHSSTHSHSHHYLLPVSSQSLTAHTLVCCLERVSVCVSFAQFGHFNMRHCLIYNRARGGAVKAVYDAHVSLLTLAEVLFHEPIMCLSFHSINHLQLNALSNPASTCFVLNTHTDYWSESD